MRQYIGARYMPKFMGTYDATTAYEALSVVDNGMGTSYVSNKPVPAGTPLTDTNYWVLYGSSSGAIIHLQDQIGDLTDLATSDKESLVDAINENVTNLQNVTSDVNDLSTSVDTERNARISADGNLQTQINARVATDVNLQTQIDNLIVPGGTAPSTAEVENARVGGNSVSYTTLGDAIRGQYLDLKNRITEFDDATYTTYERISPSSVEQELYQGYNGTTSSFSGFDLVNFTVEPNTEYYIGSAHGYTNAYGVNYFTDNTCIGNALAPGGNSLRFTEQIITTPANCNRIRLCRQHTATDTYSSCFIQKIQEHGKNLEYLNITDSLTWRDDTIANRPSDAYTSPSMRTTTINVEAGEKYRLVASRMYVYQAYTIVNDRNNIIEQGSAPQVGYGFFDITIPHNAYQLVVNGLMEIGTEFPTDHDMFTYGPIPARVYKLVEKSVYTEREPLKITFIGDSLTDPNILSGTWGNEPNYTNFVSEALNLTMSNKGIGGSGYRARHSSNLAFMDVAATIDADSDIVTIFGSWNDGASNIGTIGTLDPDTLYGAVEQTIINVIDRAPDAKIGVISPTPWQIHNSYDAATGVETYRNVLKNVCAKYSIPYLDLFNESNIRPWDSEFRRKWFKDADGTHPSSECHRIFIAPKITEFVRGLISH